jgi:two-component system, NarL family, sensor histidine kinase BarA
MSRPFGSFRLSLATKSELLFGVAVTLVILSAVLIPFVRMEELTTQLNVKAADVLINHALDAHIAYQKQIAGLPVAPYKLVLAGPATNPATTAPATAASGTASESAGSGAVAGGSAAGPATAATSQSTTRLWAMSYGPVDIALLSEISKVQEPLTRRAWQHFRRRTGEDDYPKLVRRDDDTYRFQYSRMLYMEQRCRVCHVRDAGVAKTVGAPSGVFALASVEIPSQVEPNQLLQNRAIIVGAAATAGLLAVVFLTVIIYRLILAPVRVLQETAEKVSGGDLNIRTHIASGDEFQALSETFNRMLENLKAGEDQLRAINKGLDLKLAEMAESNLALDESNRLKSEFLANVSHELRTPLNSILGFAELLSDSTRSDPKVSRYVQNIMSSGRSLLDLINDLLDLAKIEAGKMEVRSEQLSVSDLFEGLSSILRPLLEPKGLTIAVQINNDVPLMQTDAPKLQQILYNFLSNAIKFSPAGGQIELTASRQSESQVKISVADHGPGIAQDKQHMIFEKFRQIDGSHTRQYSGSGLGLSISRDLTHLLGGTIGVQSEAGLGATFWVVLPIRIDSTTQDMRPAGTANA